MGIGAFLDPILDPGDFRGEGRKGLNVVVLARGIMRRRLNAMLAGITPRARALSVGFLCLLSGDRG
jgi:hypothetical protein